MAVCFRRRWGGEGFPGLTSARTPAALVRAFDAQVVSRCKLPAFMLAAPTLFPAFGGGVARGESPSKLLEGGPGLLNRPGESRPQS